MNSILIPFMLLFNSFLFQCYYCCDCNSDPPFIGHSEKWTFNPYSLSKVEYLPRNCRHVEDGWVRCKKVRATFSAIQSSRVVGMETGTDLSGQFSLPESKKEKTIYRFSPKKCKEISGDRLGRWECQDFRWKESGK